MISLLSVCCLDYFFTDPLFTLSMTDTHDWVAMATFEGVALVVSSLSNQVRRHARESQLRQDQLQKLYELSEHILVLDWRTAVEQQLAELIRTCLHVEGVALWNAYDDSLGKSGECGIDDDAMRAASFEETGSGRALRLGSRRIGSLWLQGHTLDAASVSATATLAAIAIERARSFSTEANAEAARQSEQLRSAILDGLAHTFKSPLTTIRASSSGLLAMDTLSGTEKKLVVLIDRHAAHLNDLTNHLLLTARLDNGELKLHCEEIDLAELIESSVDTSSKEFDGHPFTVNGTTRRRMVLADRKLLEMALFQVLDNAVKYGSPGSPVAVSIEEDGEDLAIAVRNEGSFIPAEEREKVFQRFYRCLGTRHAISGTGVGLSVVKRIAEAHRGRTWVESERETGTVFSISIPRIAGGVS
jgi:two-component system sensor histidine kinase KdpD